MILIGDTSGLVAALNVAEPDHLGARTALQSASLTVISPLVLLELEHVVTRNSSRRVAESINDWLLAQEETDRFTIPRVSANLLRTARRVQRAYAALELDLTDAINVALAESFATVDILTLDRRDFRALTPLAHGAAFRLLPDDA